MKELKKKIVQKLKQQGMDVVGIADTAPANEKAPPGFSPEDQMPGAKSVIVFGQCHPAGIFCAAAKEEYRNFYYSRAEWTCYEHMDHVAYTISKFLEKEAGYLSMPIPTVTPFLIHNGTIRGRMSLKHLGQLAGLGTIGKNTLLINKEYGNLLRLGGILTFAPLPPDPPSENNLCPENCTACYDACPEKAINDSGFDMVSCMRKSVTHPILKPYIITKLLFKSSRYSESIKNFLSMTSNLIVGSSYFENCGLCEMACPYHKRAIDRKRNIQTTNYRGRK